MTSEFAPEVAKYPKSSPKPQIAPNGERARVRAYYLVPLAMQLVLFDVVSGSFQEVVNGFYGNL